MLLLTLSSLTRPHLDVLIHHDAHIAMQDLLLPATGMKYCSHAGHHIRNIKEMGDMVEDVLKTATAAACVFGYNGDHLPDLTFGTNDAAYLLDRDSSQFCDIRTVAWNDANGSASTTTMVIVCIAPGALTESDWASFCTGRVFPDRLFDYLPMYQESGDSLEGTPVNRKGRKVNRDRWTNWQRVWAITYKACRELYCSRFAVTTYQRWTFGEFKQGMETAVITPFVNASSESPDRPRLLPLLVHHCQLSRGERKANGMIDFHGILCHTCRAEALFSVADLEYHRLHPDQVAEDESLEQK
ncbi:hypothetical protein OE88DRAFT_1231493 [Heliocybe sulcata]|uniref:Uncharacterized protein n=1 Tax=Heliocybe sulcata TaxID=5364 RepID=A0A5C3MMN6_9AGAM|nr:hypothetical protein OE88DRAFT_1231493 [Heliocybe sulcata]